MTESGTLNISGSILTTVIGGETGDPIAFTVVGDTLTLDNSNSDWDFYGHGDPENADSHWVFLKR